MESVREKKGVLEKDKVKWNCLWGQEARKEWERRLTISRCLDWIV
jgi:hypothetical protein